MLYIEAGEGNSSGGHLAAQLGHYIYHYQYEDGLIRLFKQAGPSFLEDYRYRQNRSVHVAEISVSDETFEQLTDTFETRLLSQKQQIKQLAAVKEEESLLHGLLHRYTPGMRTETDIETMSRLDGAGLFYHDAETDKPEPIAECEIPHANSRVADTLKQELSSANGKNFLHKKIIALEDELRSLSPSHSSKSSNNYSFSEHYSDLLTGLLALNAIQNGLPLTKNACFLIPSGALRLNDFALRRAQVYKSELIRSAQTLIVSKRPDWGYALFVTLARIIVLDNSIERRAWTFLIGEDKTGTEIPLEKVSLYAEHMSKQRREDEQLLQRIALKIGQSAGRNEREFTELEIAANRYRRWLVSDKTGRLRLGSDRPVPLQDISALPFLITGLTETQLTQTLADVRQLKYLLLQNENKQNTYNLFSNNCVTALFKLIDQAVAGQSTARLGGYIDPASNFIPFQAFESIKNTYQINRTERLPAYRQERLNALYASENENWVYLRESNVLTSSVYNYNPDDAWFVFFTDDSVLPRPIFGAINLAAAISQSLYGLIYSPFDHGRTMKTGLRGAVASLPELAFFNIRKGSYPFPLED